MKKALFAAFLMGLASMARADAAADSAQSQRASSLSSSYHTLGVAFADIFQASAGFMSGAHGFTPPMARKKWGFNIGVLGGATVSPIDKGILTRNQNSGQLGDFAKQLPDYLPVPQAGLNAHLGLPSFFVFDSFEVGARYNGIDVNTTDIDLNLANVGLDIMGNVFEAGLVSPVTLTLGLSADSYRGKLSFQNKATLNDSTTVPGYKATGNIVNGMEMNMNNQAYALKAIVSKKLLFFNPYLGIAAQINNGTADARGYETGAVTMSDGGSSSSTSSAEIEGKASSPVAGMDMRCGGGFEMSFPFFYFSLNGEYGAISKGYGGSFQIGGQFR